MNSPFLIYIFTIFLQSLSTTTHLATSIMRFSSSCLQILMLLAMADSLLFVHPSRSTYKSSKLSMTVEGPPPTLSTKVISPGERKTFKRFMQIELWRTPELEDLYPILCSIESACSDINRLMRRVSTDNLSGYQGSMNIQGEDQKKLDIIANRIMKTKLCCSGEVSIIASEEDNEACLCSQVVDNQAFSGPYAAVFDPLDGSSNIDSGLPTGTIFGVYRKPKYGVSDPDTTVRQRGSNLVVAGYCLYAASTHIVLTMRTGLHMFTLDDVSGEFHLTRSNIKMPRTGPIYSINDANDKIWEPGMRHFLSDLKNKCLKGVTCDKSPTLRYMGALVADAHNIILNGGIFGYPGTIKAPKGKLRLLYEANPLALIIEEAGGWASNGRTRILELPITGLHDRTPLFLGSVEQVAALEKYLDFYSLQESNSSTYS